MSKKAKETKDRVLKDIGLHFIEEPMFQSPQDRITEIKAFCGTDRNLKSVTKALYFFQDFLIEISKKYGIEEMENVICRMEAFHNANYRANLQGVFKELDECAEMNVVIATTVYLGYIVELFHTAEETPLLAVKCYKLANQMSARVGRFILKIQDKMPEHETEFSSKLNDTKYLCDKLDTMVPKMPDLLSDADKAEFINFTLELLDANYIKNYL